MSRFNSRARKTRSETQKKNLVNAREARKIYGNARKEAGCLILMRKELKKQQEEARVVIFAQKAKKATQRYWNERQRALRLEKAAEERKVREKGLKEKNQKLMIELERLQKEKSDDEKTANYLISEFQIRLSVLTCERNTLRRQQTRLSRRYNALKKVSKAIKIEARKSAQKRLFKLTHRGVYTRQAREIARYLASIGTAERNIGEAIKKVGEAIGAQVDRVMSQRTVQRAMLESGVAADIQLAYEMAKNKNITYSSDSTSHRHIEYESRCVALRVIDYNDPNAEPQWKTRSLGVGTSVNHTSETQVNGLKDRLHEISQVFNDSPLAKRENLTFSPDDFAYRLVGSSGDHAADQKKSHKILHEWKLDVLLRRLGEEAVFALPATRIVAYLLPFKHRVIESLGGYEKWAQLDDVEKERIDVQVIREIGLDVYRAMPKEDQEKLTRFLRTGCCMHKDLNTVKWGDKSMQSYWKENGRTPPVLLANKDNTAVLTHCADPDNPTAAEKRAAEVSKRGGSHATLLGGMICRNKDKKKGQQDTYNWYMEVHVGMRVPYPDVSNTRYGSHGEAAAVLVVYLKTFTAFIEFIRDAKDKPGLTNIEKNFHAALQCIATLTELCVLALYCICISRPFMQYVRSRDNILPLGPYFEKLSKHLLLVASNPKLWTASGVSHKDATLDGIKWDKWGERVMETVQNLAPSLPDLNGALVAFLKGAHKAFTERFSEEFSRGGGIDQLTKEEMSELFFATTNDANEGALGSWRLAQRSRPSETINKFNSGFITRRNDTATFHQQVLCQDEDEAYLRKMARHRDALGMQKQVKEAQMHADAARVAENHQKEAKRQERRMTAAAAITATGLNLVRDFAEIDKLKNPELNLQLDWHRDNEKNFPDLVEKVPLKTRMKNRNERVNELKKAVERAQTLFTPSEALTGSMDRSTELDDTHYTSDYEDDMI